MKLNKKLNVSQLLALGVNAGAIYIAILKDLGGDETGYTYNRGEGIKEMPILPSWEGFMADGQWRDHACEVCVNLPIAVVPSAEIPEFHLSRDDFGYTGKVRIYGVQLVVGSVKVMGMNLPRYNALCFDERRELMQIDRKEIQAVARLDYFSPYGMGSWRLTFCDLHLSITHKFRRLREETRRLLSELDKESLERLSLEFFDGSMSRLSKERYAAAPIRIAFKNRDLLAYAPSGADIEELFFLADKLAIDIASL
jgi:hypothetical protein